MSDTLVLCYHALSPAWRADLSVAPDAFADQLTLLTRQGYRGVTFSDAVMGPHAGQRVAVTFDDAFDSVRRLAKPVLDALGWPATVFAVSDHVRTGRPLAWEGTRQWAETEHAAELCGMDAAALRALHDAGWEVGSHTCTHPSLPRVSDAALRDELELSRGELEQMLGFAIESIAYPYGDHDARVVAATRVAGYRRACTLPARWAKPHPLMWPRVGIYSGDDLRRFRVKASARTRAARLYLRR